MSVIDIPCTRDGNDVDFSANTVTGLAEYRQAVLCRLQHAVTFTNSDYGIDLAGELGKTSGANSLGLRASAAIMNDTRFTATLTNQIRRQVGGVESIELSFEVIVDDTGQTFSLAVLVANGEVSLIP